MLLYSRIAKNIDEWICLCLHGSSTVCPTVCRSDNEIIGFKASVNIFFFTSDWTSYIYILFH